MQELKFQWKIFHMDWVTALPLGGDRIFYAFLVLVDGYSKATLFLSFHEDDPAMDTAKMIWNRAIRNKGLFQNIISDRDPKLTPALWTNPNKVFSQMYHSKKHITLKMMG
ncbi:hypothetical protein O181_009870 [Austropuccinia psidii MF-1]|uniref:Integrase catalytic domain-containing protein n=1 Tax=Austropuccinia psidii MF-1 TaxID=1389203 RepID=A0A9Q3GKB9_9BASI|nr:hypothetical protein [Austropuccinia psidii MF-1]